MADRFPLILNTSTNQIQEIPSGDSLDLTGSGIANAGIITAGNVVVGASTTDLVVTGDARITGILTVGTSSLKLDGPNNLVNVGTALTLGHSQGVQFHTQNLHSAGFEVNQINASGIITATEADINGDLDVDGHTNLDNVSVAGVSTFAGTVHGASGDFSGQILVGVNNSKFGNNYLRFENAGIGYFDHSGVGQNINFRVSNSSSLDTTPLVVKAAGIDVTGNITATGNVSVGGVLTYEDVTNVDSIGIITARNGINVSSGTATFQGAIDANGDLDVDGHTNLDNVSIAGVVTATSFVGALTGNATSADTVDVSGAANANTEFYLLFADTNGAAKTIKIDDGIRYNASSNVLTASYFSGNGANLSGLNGSSISSGTVPVARIGTGTKNTSTFYRGDGTFATVTAPAITAINSASNNRLVTSDGGTTVTAEADITYNGTSLGLAAGKDIRMSSGGWTGEHAGKIQYHNDFLYFQCGDTDNTSGFNYRDSAGTTIFQLGASGILMGKALRFDMDASFNGGAGAVTITSNADIRLDNGTWTGNYAGKIQHHSNRLYIQGGTSGIILRDNGDNNLFTLAYNSGGNGYCNIDGPTDGFAFAKDATFNGGGGAVTIGASSDIRFTTGNWTGEHPKIQLHGDLLYICGGTHTNYAIAFRDNNGSDRFYMDDEGHLTPAANDQYDLGNSSYRWRNVYTTDLQLSNKGKTNDIDNTWGDYTIQEGESDLYLINNRSGKKYKFNLTEVS